MLRRCLYQSRAHLIEPIATNNTKEYSGGECWLILSDLADILGLRSEPELLSWIDGAGLTVLSRLDTKPNHSKVNTNNKDMISMYRKQETVSLWRLGVKC